MSNQNPHLQSQSAPAGNQTQSDPLFEQRVAALSRRERDLVKREKELNGAMTEEQMREAVKKDKAGFLKRLGVEIPDAPEDVPDHIREFRELKAQIEADKQNKANEEYRNSILTQVKGNDKYELLNKLEAYDLAFAEIDRLKQSGEEFDPIAIFDRTEQDVFAGIESVKSTNKLKSWFEPPAQEQKPEASRGYQRHPADVNRSLTAQDRASGSNQEQAPNRLLSREESIQRLAEKYQTPKG